MILDALYQFDPAETSVAIAAGTQASTNILDLHSDTLIPNLGVNQGARDMGIGDDPALQLVVQVTTSFASAGSTGTIQVAVQGAPDNGSDSPGTYTTYATGPSFVIPVAGTRLFNVDLPRPKDGLIPRYLRLLYTVAVQTMTAGKVAAYLVLDRDDAPNTAAATFGGYPAGINIAN